MTFRRARSPLSGFLILPDEDPKLPDFQVSFAPHADAKVSLPARNRGNQAGSELGPLRDHGFLGAAAGQFSRRSVPCPIGLELYALGTTQRVDGGLRVTSPGKEPVFVPFSYLHSKVPAPFQAEISGGMAR